MAPDVRVDVDGESSRLFSDLNAAMAYAAYRVRPGHPVTVVDGNGKAFVVLQRGPEFTITLSKTV